MIYLNIISLIYIIQLILFDLMLTFFFQCFCRYFVHLLPKHGVNIKIFFISASICCSRSSPVRPDRPDRQDEERGEGLGQLELQKDEEDPYGGDDRDREQRGTGY